MSSKSASLLAARLLAGACRSPRVWGGLIALTATAAAAEPPSSAQVLARPSHVEEVIVTAERRETKLQETPVAVTALSASTIENSRIVSFADVALKVPNLTYTQFSTQESYFSIRGTLINNNAAGYDEAVSTFIDEVPATGLGDNDPDLFDLNSIEVLRGPQGTLFGRNVTGGVVLIQTEPPSHEFGGRVQGTYGSDNLEEFRGMVTGPLTESLAGKISASLRRRDDYVRNVTLGGKTGGVEQADVRGQLLWTISPTLNVLFGGDYLHETSGGYATKLFGNFIPATFPKLSYDPNTTNQGFNGVNDRKIGGLLTRVTWDNPLGTLTSVTGYRRVDDYFPNSVIGDPTNAVLDVGIVRDRQFTQEVRLASPVSGRLTWVAGVFYLHSNKREAAPLDFNFNPNTVAGQALPVLKYHQTSDQSVRTDSYAVFGEAAFALTDSLKLTLGARETYERKAGHSTVSYSVVDPSLPPGEAIYAHSWSAFTPKATLSWQPSSHLLVYATVANGFKSGGYDTSGSNGVTSADVSALLAKPFQPETVWNYEIGEKFTGFDNRLALDATAFVAKSKNLQTPQLVPANSGGLVQITTNAAGAQVAGVEIEASAVPADWVNLGLTYAYMDAHFTDFPGLNGNPSNTGNRIPYSPRDQVHFSAEAHWPVPSLGGSIAFGGDYTFHSKVFFDIGNTAPKFLQDASRWEGIVNLYANYVSANGDWKLQVWGKNVTDRRPILHAADIGVLLMNFDEFGTNDAVFLAKYYPERTAGITLTRKF